MRSSHAGKTLLKTTGSVFTRSELLNPETFKSSGRDLEQSNRSWDVFLFGPFLNRSLKESNKQG